MKIIKKIIILAIIILTFSTSIAMAKFKPFVTIKIENLNTTNYIIDILVNNIDEKYQLADPESITTTEREIFEKIKKDYDGWVLANYYGEYDKKTDLTKGDDNTQSVFHSVYFGEYMGNSNFYHEFFAHDDGSGSMLTKTYKIILINKDTDEVTISEEIRNNKSKNIVLDMNSMKFLSDTKPQKIKIVVSTLVIIILIVLIVFLIRNRD